MLKRTRLSIAIGAAFGAGLASLTPTVVAQTQALDRVEITGSAMRRTMRKLHFRSPLFDQKS